LSAREPTVVLLLVFLGATSSKV